MGNKINLEKILRKHTSVEWKDVSPKELIFKAMLDFGEQLLELAAENASMKCKSGHNIEFHKHWSINKKSITNTIKQVE